MQGCPTLTCGNGSRVVRDVIELEYNGNQVGTRLVLGKEKFYQGKDDKMNKSNICLDIGKNYKGVRKEELKLVK